MKQLSLSKIISNRLFDIVTNEYREMTTEEREEYLNQIKTFLLSTCRKGSSVCQAINRMSVDNLPKNIGILERLTTKGYIAGQDYPSELRFIKNHIKKYC